MKDNNKLRGMKKGQKTHKTVNIVLLVFFFI